MLLHRALPAQRRLGRAHGRPQLHQGLVKIPRAAPVHQGIGHGPARNSREGQGAPKNSMNCSSCPRREDAPGHAEATQVLSPKLPKSSCTPGLPLLQVQLPKDPALSHHAKSLRAPLPEAVDDGRAAGVSADAAQAAEDTDHVPIHDTRRLQPGAGVTTCTTTPGEPGTKLGEPPARQTQQQDPARSGAGWQRWEMCPCWTPRALTCP